MFHDGALKLGQFFEGFENHPLLTAYSSDLFIHRLDGQLISHFNFSDSSLLSSSQDLFSSLIPSLWGCAGELGKTAFDLKNQSQSSLSFGTSNNQIFVFDHCVFDQNFLFFFILKNQTNMAKAKYELLKFVRFDFAQKDLESKTDISKGPESDQEKNYFQDLNDEELEGVFDFPEGRSCH